MRIADRPRHRSRPLFLFVDLRVYGDLSSLRHSALHAGSMTGSAHRDLLHANTFPGHGESTVGISREATAPRDFPFAFTGIADGVFLGHKLGVDDGNRTRVAHE